MALTEKGHGNGVYNCVLYCIAEGLQRCAGTVVLVMLRLPLLFQELQSAFWKDVVGSVFLTS